MLSVVLNPPSLELKPCCLKSSMTRNSCNDTSAFRVDSHLQSCCHAFTCVFTRNLIHVYRILSIPCSMPQEDDLQPLQSVPCAFDRLHCHSRAELSMCTSHPIPERCSMLLAPWHHPVQKVQVMHQRYLADGHSSCILVAAEQVPCYNCMTYMECKNREKQISEGQNKETTTTTRFTQALAS
jgi:hypothetical protein